MQASYSAYIECQGKYTAAAKILKGITEDLSKYEGKDNFSLYTSLEENDDNYQPTIWIRITGDPSPESMEYILTDQMGWYLRKFLTVPHEGIFEVYAKTVSVSPINSFGDEFFIPEVIVAEYAIDDNGAFTEEVLTYVSDEAI